MFTTHPSCRLVAYTALIVTFIFGSTLVLASLQPCLQASGYPTANPLAKKYELGLQKDREKAIQQFSRQDFDDMMLAYQHRDDAWKAAQALLSGIQSGKINRQNILQDATADMKSAISNDEGNLSSMINQIRSFGAKANLSNTFMGDLMRLQKDPNSDKVRLVVHDCVDKILAYPPHVMHVGYSINIVFLADKPYKHWRLEGIGVDYTQARKNEA